MLTSAESLLPALSVTVSRSVTVPCDGVMMVACAWFADWMRQEVRLAACLALYAWRYRARAWVASPCSSSA